jgi:Winged helix DNA-binding domain
MTLPTSPNPLPLDLDRDQVLAYRVAAHQLDRSVKDLLDLAVLDLGVQDTPYGSARLAIAARTSEPPADDGTTVLVWSTRGAPHLHRRADLAALALALWPGSDADATARISNSRIKEGALLGTAAFTAGAEAMREVVTGPMTKGDVSSGVSARVPASLTYDCPVCKARHISGGLFQQVGIAAGVRLELSGSTTMVAPIDDRYRVPAASAGATSFARTYLRLLGPAGPSDVAKFLGTSSAEGRRAWPDGLTEVRVAGRRAWLPDDQVAALRSAPAPRLVRLLPSSDPFLQARDRDLLVPDRARQKALFQILARPGALLVNGEIVGGWRAKMAGKKRLDVTVTPFEPLSDQVRTAIEAEASTVAAARRTESVRILFDEA